MEQLISVGDRLLVKDNLIPHERYGCNNFVESMIPLLGEIVTVRSIPNPQRQQCKVEEDASNKSWTIEMFERKIGE